MDNVISGLTVLTNGVLNLVGTFATPWTLSAVVIGASLAWMARIEMDLLDRSATKPEIGIH